MIYIFLCFMFFPSAHAETNPNTTKVRVRILKNLPDIVFKGKIENKKQISENVFYFKGVSFYVNKKPIPNEFFIIRKRDTVRGFDNGNSYLYDLVGLIDIESYIEGVLIGEMPAHWPLESLKAQAVAARTYTKWILNHKKKNQFFDLESDTSNQVYVFHPSANSISTNISRVKNAVEETKGQILFRREEKNEEGEVFRAFYHSHCGGYTVTEQSVWFNEDVTLKAPEATTKSVVAIDKQCASDNSALWQLVLSKDKFLSEISKQNGWFLEHAAGKNKNADFNFFQTHFEKMVFRKFAQINFLDNQRIQVATNTLRKWIGFNNLKSAKFRVSETAGSIQFQGRGRGHGVGLCQKGSYYMGVAGHRFDSILAHYYPNAFIKRALD